MSDVKTRFDIKTMHDQLEQLRDPQLTRFFANLFDAWRHTTGEDKIVPGFQNITLAASQTNVSLGGISPKSGFEWDILLCAIIDVAGIDAADSLKIELTSTDEITTQVTTADSILLALNAATNVISSLGVSQLQWTWPNTVAAVGMIDPFQPLTLRETSPGIFRSINAKATTTATAGTRRFKQFLYVRQRVV